jgi:hypothetical protein
MFGRVLCTTDRFWWCAMHNWHVCMCAIHNWHVFVVCHTQLICFDGVLYTTDMFICVLCTTDMFWWCAMHNWHVCMCAIHNWHVLWCAIHNWHVLMVFYTQLTCLDVCYTQLACFDVVLYKSDMFWPYATQLTCFPTKKAKSAAKNTKKLTTVTYLEGSHSVVPNTYDQHNSEHVYSRLCSIQNVHPLTIDSTVTFLVTTYVSEVNIFEVSPPNVMQIKRLQKKSEVLAWRWWRYVVWNVTPCRMANSYEVSKKLVLSFSWERSSWDASS